jgi:hypothetical protein
VPIGLGVSCWAQLVGVLGRVIMYLGFIILLNTYSALFAAIGARDGMDAGGTHWMTRPFWEASPDIDPGMPSLLGTFGSDFGWIQMYSDCIILIKTSSTVRLVIGWQEGVDANGAHWMMCSIYRTGHPMSRYGGHWGFLRRNLYMYNKSTLILPLPCIRGGGDG